MEQQVDVSVVMLSYYHEKYISQAIESVLMQETTYKYEIIISDDNSKDGTVDIVNQYIIKYPNTIRLRVNEKNIGLSNNSYLARSLCKGRYIAILSGDDYWIDKKKLQREIEFLDSNKKYYAIASFIEGRFDNEDKFFDIYPKRKYANKRITMQMYLKGAMIGTNGLIYRNEYTTNRGLKYYSLIKEASEFIDDATELLLILNRGDVWVEDYRTSVYRVPKQEKRKHNFNSLNSTVQKFNKIISLYNNLNCKFPKKIDLFYLYKSNIGIGFPSCIASKNISKFFSIYKTIPIEYRKRFLFIRSVPDMIVLSTKALIRKYIKNR